MVLLGGIAMFPVTSLTGHEGLFISVVGKNTTSLNVSYYNLLPKKRVRGENAGELLRNKIVQIGSQMHRE